MKKILKKLSENNVFCEEIHCSSDPVSLDGLIVPTMKKCIFDATSPHVIEPKYWGACETLVDLSSFIRRDILSRYKESLFSLIDKCSYEHRLCCCEMSKANLIKETYFNELEKNIDKKSIIRCAIDIASGLLPSKVGFPKETRRFLNAVTPDGITFFSETLKILSDTHVVFYDEYDICAHLFLGTVASVADEKNLTYISCRNPFNEAEIDHIIFPEERISFSVSNKLLPSEMITLSYEEFIKYPVRLPRLSDKDYIKTAVSHINSAKKIHDEIESIYSQAMDFSLLDEISEKAVSFFS